MRTLIFIYLFCIVAATPLAAQPGGVGPTVGYSFGFIKSDILAARGFSKGMFSSGPSIGVDIIKGIAVSFRYDMYSAKDKYALEQGGSRHLQVKQNLGKFLIGFGACDPEGGMFAAQFGFTIGHEYAFISHEYPDGTVSFGTDDPNSGCFESFRALPPLVALSGGLAVAEGLIVYLHIEKGFKKGFGDSPLQDWHFQKDLATGVSAGGASPYTSLGANDIRSWRFEAGLKYYFGF